MQGKKIINFCILQALTKLLDESSKNVSGQIFYLTDDNPVNCYYVLDPLYRKLHHRSAPNPIPVPIIIQLVFALVFHVLSLLLGPKFKLPYWGFTFMECYKVSILKKKKIVNDEEKLQYSSYLDILSLLLYPCKN